jgi:hypothetical protein
MPKNNLIKVFDHVLTKEQQYRLYEHLNGCNWQLIRLNSDVDTYFTSTFFNGGMNIPEEYDIFKQFHSPIQVLYDKIVELTEPYLGKYRPTTIYANCQTYGLNSYIHTDSCGDYTFIYYANLEWNSQNEGGTSLYQYNQEGEADCVKYVSYRPNRLLLIPSNMPHRGMPVDRNHFGPRFIVVARGKLL